MGDSGSKPKREEPPISASKVFHNLSTTPLASKELIESTFAGDEEAQGAIDRIISQLEGNTSSASSFSRAEPVHASQLGAIAAGQRIEKLTTAKAIRRAEGQADDWLQKQLNKKTPSKAPRNANKVAAQSTECNGMDTEHVIKQDGVTASKHDFLEGTDNEGVEADGCKIDQTIDAAIEADHARDQAQRFGHLREPTKPPVPGGGDYLPSPPAATSKPPAQARPSTKARGAPLYYKLLGVGVDATFEEIKRGFRREALKWHPDKNSQAKEATERFKQINLAFDTLFDPKKRSNYDAGNPQPGSNAKKLQGHGWSNVSDEDDGTLTPLGIKWKKQSWIAYVFYNGRIDDVELVLDEHDPRAPETKVKIFWRHLGEKAFDAEENGDRHWLSEFVASVWKDTPERWPKAVELQNMNEAAREEWKDRRVVYNRRKEKVALALELHYKYLALPNREQLERERLLNSGLRISEDAYTNKATEKAFGQMAQRLANSSGI